MPFTSHHTSPAKENSASEIFVSKITEKSLRCPFRSISPSPFLKAPYVGQLAIHKSQYRKPQKAWLDYLRLLHVLEQDGQPCLEPCHHLKRAVQRRRLSSSASCRSANLRKGRMMIMNPPRKMGPHRPSGVRRAERRVTPSRSVMGANVFGIAIRNAKTNTARSIGRSSRSSRSYLTNEEASSISAKSWMLGLLGNCPRGRSVQSACKSCRCMQRYKGILYVAVRRSAVVAIFSTS